MERLLRGGAHRHEREGGDCQELAKHDSHLEHVSCRIIRSADEFRPHMALPFDDSRRHWIRAVRVRQEAGTIAAPAAGILMMVYPYFTQTAMSLFGVGAVICVALWYVVRLGW